MRYYLHLGVVYMSMQIRKFMTFKGSFIMQFFSQGLNYAVTFLLMWVMVNTFNNMNGWNAYEVMLLYAINLTAYGFAGMFFTFVRVFALRDILNGAFDDVLVKPIRTLPYLIYNAITPSYVIHLTLSIIMLILCVSALGIPMGILHLLYLIEIIICGTFIFGAMFILITAPAFLVTSVNSLGSLLYFFRETSYYPLSIFPGFLQIIMTVILPYGMINFFPVQPLLGKTDYLMFGPGIVWMMPLFTIIFYGISVLVFSICLKRYKSSGS